MKKIIFGIFAHPDDEAFGPAGTLLLETRAGAELHLITLTAGDAGMNPDNHDDLGAIRLKEWRKAGTLMGATSMHLLGYQDGQLNNQSMIEIGQKIIDVVRATASNNPEAVIEFVTMDLNGVTGHIDHIVAARAACYAFYTLKMTDPRLSRIRLSCLPRTLAPVANVGWLYMNAGRAASEVDEVVDAREVQSEIIEIMRTHHTQRHDGENHIEQLGDQLGINHFIVMD